MRFLTAVVVVVGCGQSSPGSVAEITEPPSRPQPAVTAPEDVPPAPPVAAEPEGPRARALVKLVVLGEFPRELTDVVERDLRTKLEVEVERIEDVPLPRTAWYQPRRRYRADKLLEFLNDHLRDAPDHTRVLGMTSVDISTTKPPHRDWGVFGLGELGGRSCVISTFRLRRRARDADHLAFRVATTAVHEVGHTLGLDHCTEPACIMRDAEGSIRTVDTSDGRIHPECLAELDRESPLRVLVGGGLGPDQ